MSKLKPLHIGLAVTAVLIGAFFALFRVRKVEKASLAKDLDNITGGDWQPKAGDFLGEVVERNMAANDTLVSELPFSSLKEAGIPNAWLPNEYLTIKPGWVFEYRYG